MKKKIFFITLLSIYFSLGVFSQQITKFAVVDTTHIFDTFRRDTKAARDYEEKQAKYQTRIKELESEIIKLRQEKVNAGFAGEEARVKKYEAKIESKLAFLKEFLKACNDELDTLKENLINDDEFYPQLYSAIQRVAETEGYTMVLTLQQISGIIWYSETVDITDLVIEELKK